MGHPISSGNCLISQKLLLKSEFYYPLHVVMGIAYSCLKYVVLAHLSQRLIGELIVYPCSGVRRCCCCCPPFSNVFSSETAWPIKTKFYVEPPREGRTKIYINGPGHMTKMAAMPIYGQNLKKSSSPEPEVL